jgi:flagellar hook-length control protein FliK
LAQATQTPQPPTPVLSEHAADPKLVEPVQDAPAAQPRTPINTATSLVQMQIMATEKNPVVPDVAATHELDEIATFKDVSPTSSGRDTLAAAQALTASARAETARAVAGQMAAAIHARPQSGMIEIALNPEELGRVSIVMNGRDDGLHLTIATERPETLDMMRRHISLLEAEFKSLGLGDLSFDLGTSSDTGSDEQNDTHTAPSEPEHATQAQPDPSARPIIGALGRIDMRL